MVEETRLNLEFIYKEEALKTKDLFIVNSLDLFFGNNILFEFIIKQFFIAGD